MKLYSVSMDIAVDYILGPTDTSLSQDDESTSMLKIVCFMTIMNIYLLDDFMIPIILIIIMVMAGFTGAGITFGACAYQKKRYAYIHNLDSIACI